MRERPDGEPLFISVTIDGIPSNNESDKPVNGEPNLREKQANPSPSSFFFFSRHEPRSVHKDQADAGENGGCKHTKWDPSFCRICAEKRKIFIVTHISFAKISCVGEKIFCNKLAER